MTRSGPISQGSTWALAVVVLVAGMPSYADAAPVPTCEGRAATIVGTGGDDLVRGTRRADVIVALGGDDEVRAAGGDDLVCAGPGADTVFGGDGADRAFGEAGDDWLDGGAGSDDLDGGEDTDTLHQHSDAKSTVNLSFGSATGAGHDSVAGLERLSTSGAGPVVVYSAPDTVSVEVSGPHNDRLLTPSSGSSADVPLLAVLGAGDDQYVVEQDGVTVREDLAGSSGRDQVSVQTPGVTTVRDTVGGLRLDDYGAGSERVLVRGGTVQVGIFSGGGDDVVDVAAAGANVRVETGPGEDVVTLSIGRSGPISLGAGDDTLLPSVTDPATRVRGDAGLDQITGSTGDDVVDQQQQRWSWPGGVVGFTGFERIVGGPGADVLRGNQMANLLFGAGGDDLLLGREGDDVLLGGDGTDAATGGPGDDRCVAETRDACER